MEDKRKDDEEHIKKLRDDGMACKKNTSNVAYDILNLQYNQDTGGEKQKYEDDMGTLSSVMLSCYIAESISCGNQLGRGAHGDSSL